MVSAALRLVNTFAVVGKEPRASMEQFAKAVEVQIPEGDTANLRRGEALVWRINERQVIRLKTEPPRAEHDRHRRKYAGGRIEEQRRFRFRGPNEKMNLAVQNLDMFVQVAEGIDAETWEFHLRRGDYSKWFRDSLQDPELADRIESVEKQSDLSEMESRRRIKEAVQQKYTTPA